MYGRLEDDRVWLDRFMIDSKYQGKGCGKASLDFLVNHLKMNITVMNYILVYSKTIKWLLSFIKILDLSLMESLTMVVKK